MVPDISGLAITSPSISLSNPSPALSNNTVSSNDHTLQLDLSLETALSNLIHKLIQPLAPHYSHSKILSLKQDLTKRLLELYISSWDENHPHHGSGYRSLICSKSIGLPRPLRESARNLGIDEKLWIKVLAGRKVKDDGKEEYLKDEWEAWCDPGTVVWRYGGWEWDDVAFDPVRPHKENFKIIWQASPAESSANASSSNIVGMNTNATPARASHAIPIRAPVVFAIPPTPAHTESHQATIGDLTRVSSTTLLPAVSLNHVRTTSLSVTYPRSPSPTSSDFSDVSADSGISKIHSRASTAPTPTSTFSGTPTVNTKPVISTKVQPSHRGSGSGSTSSVSSSISDTNSGLSQLLTPGSRPGSADPFNMNSYNDTTDKIDSKFLVQPLPQPPSRGRTPSPHSSASRETITPSSTLTATPAPPVSTTPTVTPYDGGNVTVLGGGVKLGGGGITRDNTSSRPSSVMSSARTPVDRSRSPSISLASRALNTALGPNANSGGNGNTRKPRTRRRIMPTYLGHLGQPGVGGPIMGVFGQFAGKPPIGTGYGNQPGQVWSHGPMPSSTVQPGTGVGVGVGMGPPPTSMMMRGLPMVPPRMSS